MARPTEAFEEEVIFPDDPYAAAFLFFGVMAYPELGAGKPGGRGAEFANALRLFTLWATKKTKGVRFIREALADPTYMVPRIKSFVGPMDRGRRRIFRRLAAYDLFGTQLINGFFGVRALGAQAIRDGRAAEAFYLMGNGGFGPARGELWKQATPSPLQILVRSPDQWSMKLALNTTGNAADPHQKAKDLRRRAFVTSIPVMHMAHGLNQAAEAAPGKINGWGDREPISALLLNAEAWIWDAIDAAEKWRLASQFLFEGFDYLRPEGMVQLKRI